MTKAYALDLAERAVKTFGQAFIGAIVASYVAGSITDIADVNAWKKVAASAVVAGLSAVVSLITSALSAAKTGTASLSRTVAETSVS